MVAAVLIVAAAAVSLYSHHTSTSNSGNNSAASQQSAAKLANLPHNAHTWGFIGCSNTHDTLWGYQNVSSKDLFWPASFGHDSDPNNVGGYAYHLEGQTVYKWSNPNSPGWSQFKRMIDTYDHGQSPPVIWVQLCEDVHRSQRGTYHVTTYQELVDMLKNIRVYAPKSAIYLSTLNTWGKNPDGTWFCTLENGTPPDPTDGIAHTTSLADQAVTAGLALAGPGVSGIKNLGPLTFSPSYIDVHDATHCHPNGNPNHGLGNGSAFLGGQLASFFDK